MKSPKLKVQTAILCALIRNYHRAIRHKRIARFCLCLQSSFSDQKIRAVVRELVLQDGNWARCLEWLRNDPLFDAQTHNKLREWAAAKRNSILEKGDYPLATLKQE